MLKILIVGKEYGQALKCIDSIACYEECKIIRRSEIILKDGTELKAIDLKRPENYFGRSCDQVFMTGTFVNDTIEGHNILESFLTRSCVPKDFQLQQYQY